MGRVNAKDETEVRILEYLVRAAKRKSYWHSVNALAVVLGVAHATALKAVSNLATQGFIDIRDADVGNAKFAIALRKDYREKRASSVTKGKKK